MKASALCHLATLFTLSKQINAYGIPGISGGVNYDTGERPARRDLRDLQSSGAAFDLYIQALAQFQNDDQSDFVSYYEVAGKNFKDIQLPVNANEQFARNPRLPLQVLGRCRGPIHHRLLLPRLPNLPNLASTIPVSLRATDLAIRAIHCQLVPRRSATDVH